MSDVRSIMVPVELAADPVAPMEAATKQYVDRVSGGGAIASYRHVQSSAATTWLIDHNLGFMPSLTVVDSAGTEVFPGTVEYLTTSTIRLTFSAAFGGEAYLS